MPRVRILAGDVEGTLIPGEVRDLPGPQASQLVAEGRAELVRQDESEQAVTRRSRVRERS